VIEHLRDSGTINLLVPTLNWIGKEAVVNHHHGVFVMPTERASKL
jgi:hypothetical protein